MSELIVSLKGLGPLGLVLSVVCALVALALVIMVAVMLFADSATAYERLVGLIQAVTTPGTAT